MNFKINDRVKLIFDGYGSNHYYPVWREWHMGGTIVNIDMDFVFPYTVMWDNGMKVDFKEKHLDLLEEHDIKWSKNRFRNRFRKSFNLGDRVKLITDRHGVDKDWNPIYSIYKIVGTVVSNVPISVRWDNKFTNYYDLDDLQLHEKNELFAILDELNDI